MNKILLTVLLLIAVGLIAFNVTMVDPGDIFGKDSIVAMIGILACLCAIVLLLIFNNAKRIEKKIEEEG